MIEKHLTVSAIIIHGSKILLVKHRKLDVWLYPGGHLESNEDPIQGVKREIEEEVRQEVKILGVPTSPLTGRGVKFLQVPFAILSERISAGTEKEQIHIDLVYLCRALQSTVSPNLKEIAFRDRLSVACGIRTTVSTRGLTIIGRYQQ